MESLNPKGAKIKFKSKDYYLIFDVNVIDKIQNHFDISINSLSTLLDYNDLDFYNNVAQILYFLLNEAIEINNDENKDNIEDLYQLDQVRRYINNLNIFEILSSIISAYRLSFIKSEEINPNQKSLKVKSTPSGFSTLRNFFHIAKKK